jgi:hypothetical protein
MRASYHVLASAGVSLGLQVTMHSWPTTLGCFLSGILIDMDHYLEYYIVLKKFPYRYKDLVDFCLYDKKPKMYLFFHSYELIFVIWLLIFYYSLGQIWIGIALGFTAHVFLDQWTNPIKPLFYFLTFRVKNRFEKSKILSEKYFQRCLTGNAPEG